MFIFDVNATPGQFLVWKLDGLMLYVLFDSSLSFLVARLLLYVIPESGTLIPVWVFFDELVPILDDFAVWAACIKEYFFFFFSYITADIIFFFPIISTLSSLLSSPSIKRYQNIK